MVFIAILVAVIACGIPASYADNYEILMSGKAMTYSDAETYCESIGMTVAAKAIRDSTTVKAIVDFAAVTGKSYWVGADNKELGGYNFLWNDGVSLPSDSDLWAPGEPSNPAGKNLCVQLWNKYGLLDDTGCQKTKNPICEKSLTK
uniref:C-type lectin TC14-3 n=1 Tax=Polyandrocarpa misakiensis TaxID=7723 RepID=Q9GUY0_POLMI|nr:C-type lectin TC14-3 [Polyandrocarpa misakiensis]